MKAKAGVALSLGTPLVFLEPLLGSVDAILLLSRVTGEGIKGASFDPAAIPRVRAARAMADTRDGSCDIQVAGGVNRTNAATLVAAGARALTLGAGIYAAADMRREVAEIRNLAARALTKK